MRARGRLTLLAYLSWCSAQQQYAHPFQNVTELEQFFDANTGPGLWKWRHYFTIYDKHLSRFRGTDAKLIEIGIFSGGGLLMWRHYLGPKATIAGALRHAFAGVLHPCSSDDHPACRPRHLAACQDLRQEPGVRQAGPNLRGQPGRPKVVG